MCTYARILKFMLNYAHNRNKYIVIVVKQCMYGIITNFVNRVYKSNKPQRDVIGI